METVIRGARPHMVGDYYEPQRIDWSEAIKALERVYRGDMTKGFNLKANFAEANRVEKEVSSGKWGDIYE